MTILTHWLLLLYSQIQRLLLLLLPYLQGGWSHTAGWGAAAASVAFGHSCSSSSRDSSTVQPICKGWLRHHSP
jgi:hypothetical protein